MKDCAKILVIDDEQGIRDLLSCKLSSNGQQVVTAVNGEEALEKIKREKFRLVISDVRMPRLEGLEVLEAIKRIAPDIEVIMTTGYGTIETAVSAMKKGAYDFVQKPFNLDEILNLIEKALEKGELKAIIAVYEASKAIFASIKLGALLPFIAVRSSKILKADDISIMLMGKDGKLAVTTTHGLENDQRKQAMLSIGKRVADKAVELKEPILISGSLENDPRFQGIPNLRNIRSAIVYPLIIGGKVLGVLNANRTAQDEPFNSSDLQNMTIFGSQIAQAIYNDNLYEEIENKIKELKNTCHQLEKTQMQLIQSEKLAATGQLVAGVAHELNNPLTGILGFAQISLQSDELSPQLREDLETILKQSQRCREIIQNLLQFSRRKEPKKEPAHLVPLLEATLRLVRYDFSTAGIDIVREFSDSLPLVFADTSQLQQVFLNIINNSRHAMENRKSARLLIQACREPDKAILSFKDSGCGIPEEHLSKIFDPFFTTKPVGQGTGLGLSISHGIIQQHGGTIRVESQEGVGTTFIIELPAHKSHECNFSGRGLLEKVI